MYRRTWRWCPCGPGRTTTARTGNWLLTVCLSATLVLLGTPVVTAAQRARYRVLIGVDVPRFTPTAPEKWTWASTARWLAATRPWRKIGYHLLLGPLLALLELLVFAVAAASLAGVAAYAWAWALPSGIRQDWFGYLTQLPVTQRLGSSSCAACPGPRGQ